MIIRQFFDEYIAHSSYLLGSASACVIIDPRRDIDIYIEEAKKLQVKWTAIVFSLFTADQENAQVLPAAYLR